MVIKNNKKSKVIILIFIVLIILIFAIVFSLNYQLQSKMNEVIKSDSRNKGIKVTVHYGSYINPSILVYDLKSVSPSNNKLDVFRVFLQFAEKMKSKQFKVIEISFRGKVKFKIKGDYFQKIGQEYSWQNPIYTMRTFPQNLMKIDGSRAYPEWTGGLFGVFFRQVEDFNDFHRKWYLDDLLIKQ